MDQCCECSLGCCAHLDGVPLIMEKTPEQRIDEALESVLRASGSSLKNYTMPSNLEKMREAMRKVMLDSYIDGSNGMYELLKKDK